MMKLVVTIYFQVYTNSANVDKYLIDSITRPADDPNAGEVYYRYDINDRHSVPIPTSGFFMFCVYFQTDDRIHVEPKEVHTGQCVEQTFVPVAIGVGRLRSLGGSS